MTVSLLVVDDHELIRLGLRSMLHGAEISVVGEAPDAKQAVEMLGKHKPNVALVDVRLPPHDGFWVLDQSRRKSPKTAVIMMSAFESPTYVTRALEGGASDFLDKSAPRHEIVYAVHRAATGMGEPSSRMTRRLRIRQSKRGDRQDDVPLTNRELEVVRLVASGQSNREIAKTLGISIETVKEHMQHLLRRLQLENRTQAALWAIQEGLVDS